MSEVTAIRTEVNPRLLARALCRAWYAQEGAVPTRNALLVLLAQSALETGRWQHCWNYNLGGTKATDKWDGEHFCRSTSEFVLRSTAFRWLAESQPRTDGRPGDDVEITSTQAGFATVRLHPSHTATRFQAFRTLDEGAAAYLRVLRSRYGRAWPDLETGDPVSFVAQLKRAGYFTARVEEYSKAVVSLFSEYKEKLEFDPADMFHVKHEAGVVGRLRRLLGK